MKCLECGKIMKKTKVGNYHFTISGLDNVYLKDVLVWDCPSCGEREVVIPNIENLHEVIAKTISLKKSALIAKEIRYLRSFLGFSGAQFARNVAVKPETVSRWENGKQKMDLTTERFLRVLVLTDAGPFRDYEDQLVEFGLEKAQKDRLQFALKQNRWEKKVA